MMYYVAGTQGYNNSKWLTQQDLKPGDLMLLNEEMLMFLEQEQTSHKLRFLSPKGKLELVDPFYLQIYYQ